MGQQNNPYPYANQSTTDMGEKLRQAFNLGAAPITQQPGPAAASTRKFYKTHQGYDYGTPEGTPIRPNASGQVLQSYYDQSGFGNRALVKLDNGEQYFLSHLKNLPRTGAFQQGQVIGLTGGRPGTQGAGNTTGAHLDITPAFGDILKNIQQSVGRSANTARRKVDLGSLVNMAKQKYGNKAIAVGSKSKLQQLMGRFPKAQLVKL